MASETPQQEVVSMELPAPPGWKKQYFPKRGGTPRKNDIVFTAPTGDEIHNQRHLQQYLKSHPGGPSASDFDWGTGETPRRSTRISEKSKTAPLTPESNPPTKRRRSSASKKDNKDNEAAVEEETKTREVVLEGAEKTEDDKKTDEVEKDVQTQESEKINEVKENQNEVKDTTPTETKEPASVELKSGGDATMADAVTEKHETAFVEDDKVKEEGKQEHAKPDANNLVENEKAKADEPPQCDPNLLQEHGKLNTSANVEVKLNADVAEMDNGNKPGYIEETKGKDVTEGENDEKVVGVTENGSEKVAKF